MNICKLATLAGLDRFGSYDYAVPIGWLMEDPEKRRPHFWWYSQKPGSLFGRPLAWRAVARLALWKMRREFPGASFQDISDFLNTWAVAHPEKPLDAFGRKLIARCIEKEVCRDRFDLHLVLVNLRYCFKSASVPMPDFIMEEKPAAENRQAA